MAPEYKGEQLVLFKERIIIEYKRIELLNYEFTCVAILFFNSVAILSNMYTHIHTKDIWQCMETFFLFSQ